MRIVWVALLCTCAWAWPGIVRAQSAPGDVSCSVADRPGGIVQAARPVTPPEAVAQHITGRVVVIVTLDANANVVSAAIAETPSAILNRAALDAAKRTIFQLPVVNCKPKPGPFKFIVIFDDLRNPLPPPVIASYYTGAWSCVRNGGPTFTRTFRIEGQRLATSTDTAGSGNEEQFTRLEGAILYTSFVDGVQQFSGWTAPKDTTLLTFRVTGYLGGKDDPPTIREMIFHEIDDDHYSMTSRRISGPGGGAPDALDEQCSREKP